jgi:sulfur carrier protein ThiS
MTLSSSNGPASDGSAGQTVHVRLFGELVRFVGERGYSFDWPLRAGQTVAGLLAEIGIPAAEVWMVAINGVKVPSETEPQAGDEIMVFSPVGGG